MQYLPDNGSIPEIFAWAEAPFGTLKIHKQKAPRTLRSARLNYHLPITELCSLFPGAEIVQLLIGECIDLHTHRFELDAGDLIIDLDRDRINLLL